MLLADHLVVQGNVQAPADRLQVYTRTMSVESRNLHDPLGLPDSGVSADRVQLWVDEQLHVGGWVQALMS